MKKEHLDSTQAVGPACPPSRSSRLRWRGLGELRPLLGSWAIWAPLVGFVVPTLIIGYGIVMPRHGILGEPELSLGFGSTVLGACLTYLAGIRIAWAVASGRPERGER